MECHELETILADYLEGDLTPAQTDDLLDHVEGCEACRAEFQAFQELDGQLTRYFKVQRERADGLVLGKDELVDLPTETVESGSLKHILLAAAAIAFMIIGYATWHLYRNYVPQDVGVLAHVKEAGGRVQIQRGGQFVLVAEMEEIRQSEIVKVSGDGYLAMELADGNILEARAGTQFELLDFPKRLVVKMDQGQVWAHLIQKPEKPFAIETSHLTATATGTVYGVEEGIDRSVVIAAQGEVFIECGARELMLYAVDSFCSRIDVAAVADLASTAWSQYQENLAELVAEASEEPPLQTQQAAVATTSTLSINASVSLIPPIDDLIDVLPPQTRYFLDIRDWPGILQEFSGSDYSALIQEESIQKWWNYIKGEGLLDEFTAETHIKELFAAVKLLDGQLSVAAGVEDFHFVLVADCESHAAEVQLLLDQIVFSEEMRLNANPADPMGGIVRSKLPDHAKVADGRLIVSSSAALTQAVEQHLLSSQKWGFAESEFYKKVMAQVSNPRFIMAADIYNTFADVIAGAQEQGQEDLISGLHYAGIPGCDYLIISPSFTGAGMNQTARVGFRGDRYGMMDWLGEPAPMRGLKFFSQDVLLCGSVIAKSPRQMMNDYLEHVEETHGEDSRVSAEYEFSRYEGLFDVFGGEIAVAVDSPILPVPNIKIAIEVADQPAFFLYLESLVGEFIDESNERDDLAFLDKEVHEDFMIYSMHVDGAPLKPAWAFIDDYLIIGPGPQFVRHSIDIYESGHSIVSDSKLSSLLPSYSGTRFSALIFQDVARAIPQMISSTLAPELASEEFEFIPDIDFLETYEAAGIAYANASDSKIDLHFNTPGGLDFNLGGAATLVDDWLGPQIHYQDTMNKREEALLSLDNLKFAAEMYARDKGSLPDSLMDLLNPEGVYIDANPPDPIGQHRDETLQLIKGTAPGTIILYSIGPDQFDDRGTIEYDPMDDIGGSGDITVTVPMPAEETAR